MSRTKPAPSWSEAVSAVLGDRDPHREQAFDTDATVVIAALKALVATGRCVATGPNAAFQPIRTLRVAAQDEAGAAPPLSGWCSTSPWAAFWATPSSMTLTWPTRSCNLPAAGCC